MIPWILIEILTIPMIFVLGIKVLMHIMEQHPHVQSLLLEESE